MLEELALRAEMQFRRHCDYVEVFEQLSEELSSCR